MTDSVCSVDGDAAPLAALGSVDDAHGFGVLGEGGHRSAHAAELAGRADTVATLTRPDAAVVSVRSLSPSASFPLGC